MKREVESEIIPLIKDLQKRMTYLEKKIDLLVKQNSERSPGVKSYSSGPRTYGGPQRYSNTRENRYGTSVRSGSSRPDDRKRGSEGRVFPKKNQTFRPAGRKRSDKS